MIQQFKRLISLLPGEHRGKLWLLVVLMLVGMVLETLGVGLVVPAMALLANPEVFANYPWLNSMLVGFSPFHWAESTELLDVGITAFPMRDAFAGAMVLLVLFFSFKAVFLVLMTWYQTSVILDAQIVLSRNLFASYLRQPYTFHLQRNSAELIRNATKEISQYGGAFISAVNLVAEALVVLGVVGLLIFFEPVGAVSIFVFFGFFGWLFQLATKKKIHLWAQLRHEHEGARIQHLQQGLGGVKEVKLLGREEGFIAEYAWHTMQSARMSKRENFFFSLPRFLFEWLAVVGLAILVFFLIGQGRTGEEILLALGLFGAAAFRVMPSVNRVISNLQVLRFSHPAINVIHEELGGVAPPSIQPVQTTPSPVIDAQDTSWWSKLELEGVGFVYPGSSKPALEEISLEIERGVCLGFVGGSGAGKSTLIDLLMGLYAPSSGKILLDGKDLFVDLRAWQSQIGYVPQTIFLTDDTLRKNIAFGIPDSQIDDEKVRKALESAQLVDFINELPDTWETMVGERGVRLSGGQRQRIGIARALYHQPSVLILDEATSALDVETESAVIASVNHLRSRLTILMIAHRYSTVAGCDRLVRLENGKIQLIGSYAEVIK